MTQHRNRSDIGTEAVITEGETCWRKLRADRLAFLVDAAAYFRAFKAAALRARHSILIVGWDVNSRTPLGFDGEADENAPNELGPLLDHLAGRHDGLMINVLCWDSPLLYAGDREWLPQARFDWFTHPRLCFALDDQHPLGASHHQKLAVIDDSIAFVGGIDLTISRLDEPEHRPDDPRRRNPDGSRYPPHHDLQVAAGGPAARALGEVARERWTRATGQRLQPVDPGGDRWPDDLSPDLTDAEVAIARTVPPWKGHAAVREVEALFLESIARARESLYIENQYFSSTSVGRAIEARLDEPDGPEFVLVIPEEPTGWLEQTAMGINLRRLLAQLRKADRHGRFRVYTPVVGEGGQVAVKVHAKAMVVDGRLLRIGSANLNNRSMGLDTECDLALEGAPSSATAEAVTGLRDRLLAEHLGTSADRVAREIEARGSLIATVEALRGSGRSLAPFPEVAPDEIDTVMAETRLLDPDAPAEPERIAHELAGAEPGQATLRNGLLRLAAVVVLLLGLAALWRWGPASALADPGTLEAWGESLRDGWPGTAAVLAAYLVGGMVMFPVVVLIAGTGLLFGPLSGLLIATTGSLASAVAGYAAGALLGRGTLRSLSGSRLERISRHLARRGVLSMAIIRLLPLAPFTLINLAAGASHISLRDFVLGTLLGMAPGIVTITLFSGQLGQVVRNPDLLNIVILAGLMLLMGGTALWSWRHFGRRGDEADDG